jgi:glutamate-ammonia-ligase adenylyltransferase
MGDTDARFPPSPDNWPRPADPAAADRLVERFAAIGAAEARLAGKPAPLAMLRAIGGNSPYLSDLALREAATVRALFASGPDAVVRRALAALGKLGPATERRKLAAGLRAAKRVVALAAGLADIGGIWDLGRVVDALSRLAEQALAQSVAHILLAAHDAGELRLPDRSDPARGSGLTVLGMGKLGARELNYSSDVDLILLYDPAAGTYAGDPDGKGQSFTRYARALVALMEARDADGYVFRTDLRLRPDPAATPPAVTLQAALAYYESMGQNWERAAMLKARPVAGDIAMGEAFLEAIRPFIWRRGLDFAAVADLYAMKRRIDAHRDTALADGRLPAERVAGHDVKLGEGGIREIEFLTQTLQLVWGGRDPALRERTTLGALQRLVAAGRLPATAARELAVSYACLRQVEHRLQMMADRQTHALPERLAELERFAVFMGFADAAALAAMLLGHFARVRRHYATVFEQVPEQVAAPPVTLDFRGDGAAAEATAWLVAAGFADPAHIVSAVRGWQAGRLRALRSERARLLMEQMLPAVLAALAHQPQPDLAFNRFDTFLARLPAGVPILSLFQRNPALLGRVATVLGAAPALAEHLASHPASLDGLLMPEAAAEPVAAMRARLADARDLEDAIGIVRRHVREEEFSLSVATLEGRLPAVAAAERRSALLDAALDALLPRVLFDYGARNGAVEGGEMGIVLLGKAGGRRMMAGSDLDMMLIYDHPEHVTESRGARSVAASQWFVRAAHAVVGALTTPGVDGPLYDVDMRLRPSGNKGPVAVSLASFRRYHAEAAWTWERMALTRARVATAPPRLRAAIEAAIAEALGADVPADQVRADAAAMRGRLAREFPGKLAWDVKYRPGGMIDAEFIEQVRVLTTRAADAQDAWLGEAWTLFFTVQSLLRILIGRRLPDLLPPAAAEALVRAVAAQDVASGDASGGSELVDAAALLARLDAVAARVRALFVARVGPPGKEVEA